MHYAEPCLLPSAAVQLDLLPDGSPFCLTHPLNSVNTHRGRLAKPRSVLPLQPALFKEREERRKSEVKNPARKKKKRVLEESERLAFSPLWWISSHPPGASFSNWLKMKG